MPYTLDMFLKRMNEVSVGSQIKVLDFDAKGDATEKEVTDVVVKYDTKTTEVLIKTKTK